MFATARQTLLAIGLLAASTPALAQSSSSIDVSSWLPVDYNDYVIGGEAAVTAAFDAYGASMATGDLDQMYYARQNLQSAVDIATYDLLSLPPYLGDSTLRDTSLARYAFYNASLQGDLPSMEVLLANGDLVGAQAIIDRITAEETRYDDLVQASQEAFAARWGFTLEGSEDSSLAASSSYANSGSSYVSDTTYTEPKVIEEDDDVTVVSVWGAIDRGLQDDMKGWSLGYDSAFAPKISSGLSWRHQDFGVSKHDRVELVVSPTILSSVGDKASIALKARVGGGYGFGDGQKGWGVSAGGAAELGLGTLYAFVRADRGFWGGDLKDEYAGWDAQAGVGARIRI